MEKNINENIIDNSKRTTNKLISLGLSGFFIYPLFKILNSEINNETEHIISLDKLIYKNIYVDDKVILCSLNNNILVFENKCTHLGCKIQLKNNTLVCPCHGSEYNNSGKPTKGPAIKELKKINFKIENNNIIIKLC